MTDWRKDSESTRRRLLADLLGMLTVTIDPPIIHVEEEDCTPDATDGGIAGANVRRLAGRIDLAEQITLTLTDGETVRATHASLIMARNDLLGLAEHVEWCNENGMEADAVERVQEALERVCDDCAMAWPRLAAKLEAESSRPREVVDTIPDNPLLNETDKAVMAIAGDQGMDLEEKMRRILLISNEAAGWKSGKWAELLKVTPGRIRQTGPWKVLQGKKNAPD